MSMRPRSFMLWVGFVFWLISFVDVSCSVSCRRLICSDMRAMRPVSEYIGLRGRVRTLARTSSNRHGMAQPARTESNLSRSSVGIWWSLTKRNSPKSRSLRWMSCIRCKVYCKENSILVQLLTRGCSSSSSSSLRSIVGLRIDWEKRLILFENIT